MLYISKKLSVGLVSASLLLTGCGATMRAVKTFSQATNDSASHLQIQSGSALANCGAQNQPAPPPIGPVDTLNYMLAPQAPSYSGFLSTSGVDPDQAGLNTFYIYKFANRDVYEAYHYDNQAIYLRYEVVKPSGWIRTFDELNKIGSGFGALWAPRQITPGNGAVITSNYAIDRSDRTASGWSINPSQSLTSQQNMLSFSWATVDVGNCDLRNLLRMRQEWDPSGNIFEHYDYGAGQGLLHWEWVERLDHLMSRPSNMPGRYIGTYDAGTSFVIEIDQSVTPPIATSINLADNSRVRLPVYQVRSSRTGVTSWYVVTRAAPDARGPLKEQPRYFVNPAIDIQIGNGLTLAQLPHLHTAAAPIARDPANSTNTNTGTPITTAPTSGGGSSTMPTTTCTGFCEFLTTGLYPNLLDRPADSAGLQYWTSVKSSLTCSDLAVYFISTKEAQDKQALRTNEAFVRSIYKALLNRDAEPLAISNALNYFAAGTLTRSGLTNSILGSGEFDSLCKSRYGFPNGAGAHSPLPKF